MTLTPNYGFIIPTGSDAVNLLTQCYPNFSLLDTILKPIQESGVTVATDTKVGTVHQLVRTDSSCNMFRFIATGNYASGDTFTVDGATVTATAMDGTALSAGAFVINQSVVCILNNLVLTVLVSGKETTLLPASAVTYDNTGSGLTASNVQDAIDEVYGAIPVIPPVTEHGIYELWNNNSPQTAFSAGDVVIANYDTSKFDGIIIATEDRSSDVEGASWREYDNLVISNPSFTGNLYMMNMDIGTGKITYYYRTFTVSLVGNTLTLSFASAKASTVNTYGSGGSVPADDNTRIIPVRVLGIAHNS